MKHPILRSFIRKLIPESIRIEARYHEAENNLKHSNQERQISTSGKPDILFATSKASYALSTDRVLSIITDLMTVILTLDGLERME